MDTLDTITRIFMISSLAGMIGYAFGMGLDCINRATERDKGDTDETI